MTVGGHDQPNRSGPTYITTAAVPRQDKKGQRWVTGLHQPMRHARQGIRWLNVRQSLNQTGVDNIYSPASESRVLMALAASLRTAIAALQEAALLCLLLQLRPAPHLAESRLVDAPRYYRRASRLANIRPVRDPVR